MDFNRFRVYCDSLPNGNKLNIVSASTYRQPPRAYTVNDTTVQEASIFKLLTFVQELLNIGSVGNVRLSFISEFSVKLGILLVFSQTGPRNPEYCIISIAVN